MNTETIVVFLIVMFIGYIVMTYKKLLTQYKQLDILSEQIKSQQEINQNTDSKRRTYNHIARNYNNTLTSFVGKRIAKRENYEVKSIIEK